MFHLTLQTIRIYQLERSGRGTFQNDSTGSALSIFRRTCVDTLPLMEIQIGKASSFLLLPFGCSSGKLVEEAALASPTNLQ